MREVSYINPTYRDEENDSDALVAVVLGNSKKRCNDPKRRLEIR